MKYFNFTLIFLLIVGYSNIILAIEEQSTTVITKDHNTVRGDTIVLRPKINISNIESDELFTYNINIANLRSYLENIMIVENPGLQNVTKRLSQNFTSVVDPVKDLGINSKESRYVLSFANTKETIVGPDANIFVSGIAQDNYLSYSLIKPGYSYYHPKNQEYLGTEIVIIGQASVLQRGEISLLRIDSCKEPIRLGTLILPSRSLMLPDKLSTFYDKNTTVGYVLSILPGLLYGTNNNSVIVSLGARDNIKVGQLFDVLAKDEIVRDPYDRKKTYLIANQRPKATIVIYDVFNKLSLGYVIDGIQEIRVMDKLFS